MIYIVDAFHYLKVNEILRSYKKIDMIEIRENLMDFGNDVETNQNSCNVLKIMD